MARSKPPSFMAVRASAWMRCALQPTVSSTSSGSRPQPAARAAEITAKLRNTFISPAIVDRTRVKTSDDYSPEVALDLRRELEVPASCAGLRLDRALAQLFPQHSRTRLQGWLKDGHVQLDGAPRDAKHKVWGGERLL